MKRGIVFEINDAFLILLTPDGQFLQAKNQGQSYQIGQEIDFIPLEEKNASKTFRFTLASKLSSVGGKRIAAAAIGLLVLTASLFPFYQDNKVYAYMTIDNASSVELAVNKDLEVIELIPYNKQGEEIVDNIDEWKKQDLSAVSNKVLEEMGKQGIKQDKVILSTVFEGDRNQELDKRLNKEIEEIKEYTKSIDTQITLVSGTMEDRKQAKKQGKSTGEYKQKISQDQKDKVKPKKPKAKYDTENQQNMQNNLPNKPAPDAKGNKKLKQNVDKDHPKKANPNTNKTKEKQSKPEKQKEKRQDENFNQSKQNHKQPNENNQNPNNQQGFGIEKSGLIMPGLFFHNYSINYLDFCPDNEA